MTNQILGDLKYEFALNLLNSDIKYINNEIFATHDYFSKVQKPKLLVNLNNKNILIIDKLQMVHLQSMSISERIEAYQNLILLNPLCIIFCYDIQPEKLFIDMSSTSNIPVFQSALQTSHIENAIENWLEERFSQITIIHGCLIDINGVGILIQGESGIGKSETVLELIKRGHRLIADDAVEIHKLDNNSLLGKAPDILKNFLEIRGIGIVNIKDMFGTQAIKDSQSIELVITLKIWDCSENYERLGFNKMYTQILDNQVQNYIIPVRPGRNLAVIIEAAALNYRQNKFTNSGLETFDERIQNNYLKERK